METEYSKTTGRPLKPCPAGFTRNPVTNRCIKKGSAPARKITRKTKVITRPKHSPGIWCNLTQLQARRLILTVGLGRDLVARDLPTARNPNKLCDTLTNMLKTSCTKGWKVTKFLAAGAYGHVFRAVKNDGTKAVMKVQVGSAKEIRHEVKTQKRFCENGLAPKILGYCSFKPQKRLSRSAHNRLNDLVNDDRTDIKAHAKGHLVHIIVMKEIAGVIGDWLHPLKSKEQLGQLTLGIFELMESLKKHKLTHGDLHLWNLGYVYTDESKRYMKLMPIDFGRSFVGKAHTEFELGALLRILNKEFHEKPMPDFNRRVVANLIRALAKIKFGISFPKSLREAEANYDKQQVKYMEKYGFW